ncbi:MAG: hypothetical protein CM15mV5_1840 [uncultured marine virus]|nr:MAG: hypothetical protein CM15mV5_1840 [uncultured marine virus]
MGTEMLAIRDLLLSCPPVYTLPVHGLNVMQSYHITMQIQTSPLVYQS